MSSYLKKLNRGNGTGNLFSKAESEKMPGSGEHLLVHCSFFKGYSAPNVLEGVGKCDLKIRLYCLIFSGSGSLGDERLLLIGLPVFSRVDTCCYGERRRDAIYSLSPTSLTTESPPRPTTTTTTICFYALETRSI